MKFRSVSQQQVFPEIEKDNTRNQGLFTGDPKYNSHYFDNSRFKQK